MSKKLNEVIGTMAFDGLIVATEPVADVVTITLAAGGVLKRGTVVTGTAGGALAPAAAALDSTKATYILADDVDTAESTTAIAYRTGHFAANKLITNGTYALTAADKETLRKAGILLSDAVEI